MGGFVAIDVGDSRVGVAVSEEESFIASPLAVYERKRGRAEKEILELIRMRSPRALISGLPLDDYNKSTRQTEKTERFCRRIGRRSGIEVIFIDEYGTSVESEEILRQLGRKTDQNLTDAIAAALILQSYLDSCRKGGKDKPVR